MLVCSYRWYNEGSGFRPLQDGSFFITICKTEGLRVKIRAGLDTCSEEGAKMKTNLAAQDEQYNEAQNKDVVEIRWHGRGGQGAKTACLLLADVAFSSGKQVQGFPEYGPERMGAPITAYNRISGSKCSVHSNIYNPDYVVVVDETLLATVDVTHGLKESGAVIINSDKKPQELRPLLKGYQGRVYSIDARKISEETLGKNFPNTPMLAAAVKVSNVVDRERFLTDMESSFRHKFASKPHVVEGNLRAITRSLEEVCAG